MNGPNKYTVTWFQNVGEEADSECTNDEQRKREIEAYMDDHGYEVVCTRAQRCSSKAATWHVTIVVTEHNKIYVGEVIRHIESMLGYDVIVRNKK